MNSFTHFKLRYNLASPRKLLALLLAASMLPAIFFSGSNHISAAPEGAGGGSISGYLIIASDHDELSESTGEDSEFSVDDPSVISEDTTGDEYPAAPEDSRPTPPAEDLPEDFDEYPTEYPAEYPTEAPADERAAEAAENPIDTADHEDYAADIPIDVPDTPGEEAVADEAAPEDVAVVIADDTPAAEAAILTDDTILTENTPPAEDTIPDGDMIAAPAPAPAVYEFVEEYQEASPPDDEPGQTPDDGQSEPPENGAPPEGPAPSVITDDAADADIPAISPLAGHTLSLYFADDLTASIYTAEADADGKYAFTGLDPGIYKVGLPLRAEDGTLYQLSDGDADGGFEAEQDSEPPMAFSRTLEITPGAMEIENISARLKIAQEQSEEMLMESESMNILSATAPIDLSYDYGGTVNGDGYTITVVSSKQVLTITSDAGGPYTIIQSDYSSCLFRNIVVNNGVTAQITIVGINVESGTSGTPPFALQGSANVELVIENNMAGGHNRLAHTYAESTPLNCAALYVPVSASLTISGSGKLEARGARYGAGIGGGGSSGTYSSAGTITISGGTVEAWGSNAAGIGGSYYGKSGKITIEDGNVTATGGNWGAGIGYGYVGGAVDPNVADTDQFNSITITGGRVTANGGQYGAGIGGSYGCGGGRITITGGVVVAEGGHGSSGAGIGGGYNGKGGFITISGDANITATGGSATADGSYEAPGIGGYSDGANNTLLTLDHTATVRAYSSTPITSGSRPAIYTGGDPISGTGYFVNAYFPSGILPVGGDIRLDVYANGGADVTTTLTLPARKNNTHATYRGFAYTTGTQTPQDDRILAYGADGSGPYSVVRNDNSSQDIRSYNDRTHLIVKLGGPKAGALTYDELDYKSVRLTSTEHSLGGYAFIGGGFRYSASPDMAGAVDVPWDAGPFTSSAVSKYVFGLAPDTVYYAQAYLNTNFVGGIVYSPVVSFKTPAHTVIDLSETDTDGTGYTVSGSSPNQTLTINSSAGSPYTIIQSGGNDPSTSIFQNIVVNGGLTVTIMIREINVRCETDDVPVFSVKASASATTALELLLDGDNTLTQSATGAGNNAALSVSRPNELNMDNAAVLTIDTADGGGGSLTAKGGAGGAGIGGGDSGLSGKININGGDITAVGGAGTNGGAGIGGNGGSGAGINGGGAVSLALASAASVKAYSYTSDYPAIQAPGNSGDGYYVNAYFGAGEEPSVLTGAATRLNVYTENDQINAANTLELPNTYRSFAYTTNKTVEQSDSMWAIDTASSVPLGFVTRYDNGSPLIGSVKNPGTLQRVKLNSVAGSPSVMNIQKDGAANRADFTSTGHALPYGATLSEGGFRYSNSKNSETGALTGDISTKLWAEQTAASPKTETVEGLEPNTRYHMATYLNIDIFGGTQNFTSGSIPFATLPYIESASSAADEDDDTAALISADFYESTATNIAIDSVTLYWDTSPIDAGSPETAAHSEALTPGAYSDAGFTNYRLEGLSAETVYNLLLVIENESGADSRAFTHAPFEINVSVPVKLIFAAFDTDAGDITAPVYHIKNNGKNTASVTVDGFDEIDGDELTLTKDPPGANGLQLKLEGTGASLGTGMTDYLEISSSINEPLCTLQGFGEADDTYYFTFSGKYNGAFSTVRRPEYFLVLKFGLSQP